MRRLSGDVMFALVVLAIASYAVWDARDWDTKARMFPWVIGFPMIGMAAIFIVLRATGLARDSRTQADLTIAQGIDPVTLRRRSTAFLSWLLGFAGGVWMLGFLWGGPAITLAYLKLGGRERWPVSLALAAGTWLMVWILQYQLHIPFPKPALLQFFGINAPFWV